MTPSPAELFREAQAHLAAGRFDEAVARCRDLIAASPESHIAESNLANILDERGRYAESEPHWRAAIAKGDAQGGAHLALARNLLAQRRYDEAEAAFRALRGAGVAEQAHLDLAELRWRRTGNADDALKHLDAALRDAPSDPRLLNVKAAVLNYVGRPDESLALLRSLAVAHPTHIHIAATLAQSAVSAGAPDADALAERALSLAPDLDAALRAGAEAALASGDAARAAHLAEQLRAQNRTDQYAIALLATAWRMLGDPRYRVLYDYDSFVSTSTLATPPGWRDLPAYLADLATALRTAHAHDTHPFGQSIRHGSQATDILKLDHPAARALPAALDPPIRAHLAKLGRGGDPVRARNVGGYAFQGMWSIQMPAGGFHVDHVHSDGWLSSACYVELPDVTRGREGWLRFGKPGVRTKPALDAEHVVQPAPGMLVLFPSYMWHGTVPFTDDRPRLTFAFDLVPTS